MSFDVTKANFRIEGEGTPFFLIGGQFMTMKGWEPMVEDLKRFYKVIVLEYPNQGQSENNLTMTHLRNYAEYTRAFMEYQGIKTEETVVFGLSFGAQIIKSLALDFGVRFKAAILGAISSYKLKNYILANYLFWIHLIETTDLELTSQTIFLKLLSPAYIESNPGVLELASKQMVANYGQRLDSLICLLQATVNYLKDVQVGSDHQFTFPVHLIGATADPMMPFTYVEDYAKVLRAPLHQVEGGHVITMEQPFELISIFHHILELYAD